MTRSVLKTATPWSVHVTNRYFVNTPEQREICGHDQALCLAFTQLNQWWMDVDDVIRYFSHWFTNFVAFDGLPVVTAVFRSGYTAYAELYRKRDAERTYYAHHWLSCLLTGCFRAAQSVCQFTVVDEDSGDTWTLRSDSPLCIWRLGRTRLRAVPLVIDEALFSRLLYDKAVPHNMQLTMRRFDHEDAILAGDLDNCL